MLRVPDGTVVQTVDGTVLADLVGAGTTYEVARGGRGGRGNAALANTRRRAPGFAELGEPGDQLDVVLELKSVADVGLVGFPSAGKSSLISVLSAARPKIADYPFTTLVPNLGVVQAGDGLVRHRRRARPDPGRGHRQGAGPGVPAPHRALRGAGPRGRLARRWRPSATRWPTSTRSRRSWPPTAAWPTGRGWSCSTRSTFRTAGTWPRSCAPTWTARGWPIFEVSAVDPRGAARADLRAGRASSREHRARRAAAEADPDRAAPAGGRRRGLHHRAAERRRLRGRGAQARALGARRPTSTTTRRSATWPTGWPGSASRRRWPRRAPSPAAWYASGPGVRLAAHGLRGFRPG